MARSINDQVEDMHKRLVNAFLSEAKAKKELNKNI